MVHGLSKSGGGGGEGGTKLKILRKTGQRDIMACTVGIKTKYLQGSRKDMVRYSKVNVNPGKIDTPFA